MGLVADIRFAIKAAVARGVENLLRVGLSPDYLQTWQRYGKPPDVDVRALVAKYAGWVYACANISGNGVARVPIRLYAGRGVAEKAPAWLRVRGMKSAEVKALRARPSLAKVKAASVADDYVEVMDHPLLDLLRNVNSYHNQYEMMEGTTIMLDLTGDAYWYLVPDPVTGQPGEMWLLRSQWVRIVPDAKEFVKGYLYGPNEEGRVKLEPSEVIHFRYFNPLDEWYGLGRVQAAAWAVQRQHDMDRMESTNLQNMGRPAFGVRYKGGKLTRKDVVELEAQWASAFSGPGKAGRIKIMDEDCDVVNFGWSPREMEFMQGRPWTRDEICSAFPVPLGLFDPSTIAKAPRAGVEGTELFMAKYNTSPRCQIIEQKLNEQLTPLWGDRFFLAFDDPVQSDRDYELRRTTAMLGAAVVTVNEVRGNEGLEPVPWGDVPLLPMTTAPLGTPTAAEGEEEIPSESTPSVAAAARNAAPGGAVAKAAGATADGAGDDAGRSGGPNPPPDSDERALERVVRDVFGRQEREAVRNAQRAVIERRPPIMASKWTKELAHLAEPVVARAVQRAGTAALGRLARLVPPSLWRLRSMPGKGAKRAVPVTFAEAMDAPAIREAIEAFTFAFSEIVTEDTVADLDAVLREVLTEGIGDPHTVLAKKIHGVFDKYGSMGRALMIARTEMARAVTAGDDAAWRESGVVLGKEWDPSADACPFCIAMKGKEVRLGENFFRKGDSMSVEFQDKPIWMNFGAYDVDGPPLHPNCRCVLLPVVDV